MSRTTVAVVGGGAWGTALACLVAGNGHPTALLTRHHSVVESLAQGVHPRLAGICVPDTITVTTDPCAALQAARFVIFAVPITGLSRRVRALAPLLRPDATVVSGTKGIDGATLRTPSTLLARSCGDRPVVVLAGPTLAVEVATGAPAIVVCAGTPWSDADAVASILRSATVRTLITEDVIGSELGGSLKNVYNLVIGYAGGLGWGHNGVAALLDACIVELRAVALAAGAVDTVVLGPAGLGDLIAAASAPGSRNRRYGESRGRGEQPDIGEATEGVSSARPAARLAARHGVPAPLLNLAVDIAADSHSPGLGGRLIDAVEHTLAHAGSWSPGTPEGVQGRRTGT